MFANNMDIFKQIKANKIASWKMFYFSRWYYFIKCLQFSFVYSTLTTTFVCSCLVLNLVTYQQKRAVNYAYT